MRLSHVSFRNKQRISRFVKPCIVCGKRSTKRVDMVFEHEDGVREARTLCYSYPIDRQAFDEVNQQWIEKGLMHKVKQYEEVYPLCWKELFGQDIEIPVLAGKVMKRDKDVSCCVCGKCPAEGGFWISSMKNVVIFEKKRAICGDCLMAVVEKREEGLQR